MAQYILCRQNVSQAFSLVSFSFLPALLTFTPFLTRFRVHSVWPECVGQTKVQVHTGQFASQPSNELVIQCSAGPRQPGSFLEMQVHRPHNQSFRGQTQESLSYKVFQVILH
jgi:hypothetical protein